MASNDAGGEAAKQSDALTSPGAMAATPPRPDLKKRAADWLSSHKDSLDAGAPAFAELEILLHEIAGQARRDGECDAFVAGAAWWEFHSSGGTIWQSDRRLAESEAERRYPNGHWQMEACRGQATAFDSLAEALNDYRRDPVNARDGPRSWRKLAVLLDACDEIVRRRRTE